jgi:hypothetical protein
VCSRLRHYATSRKVAGSISDDVIGIFSIDLIFQPHNDPEVDSASKRNEYQISSWGKWRRARKADNLTVICEPIF